VSFPSHDPNWSGAANFLATRAAAGAAILAPDIFWRRFPKIYRYVNTHLEPSQEYDWIVAHKGRLDQLGPDFLGRMLLYQPVFANAVFVVLSRTRAPSACDPNSNDVKSLWLNVEQAIAAACPPTPIEKDIVLPDRGMIEALATLDEQSLRSAMNRFWAAGGYVYPTLRDRAYYREIDAYIDEYVGQAQGLEILDLACGTGRLDALAAMADTIEGIDISDTAIEMARKRHEGDPRMRFTQMDAHALDYPDAQFDLVLFIDAIEHVLRARDVLAEAARVLKPGGRLVVTVANRDSVNQFINCKLGFGEFETNYQHVREFSYSETLEMVEGLGFQLVQAGGLFLYPYWGIPGVDQAVRHLTDDDAQTVELFRVLGRRVGPEYAYAFVMLLEKGA
jgi:2-polyprenyl-3-methyl-5-hydroxy-6-metoxy-1,4-benzoquinol methylase